MVSNNGCAVGNRFFLPIAHLPLMACLPLTNTQSSTIFDPSFQQPTGYTACSIDQCEDARPGEPPHTPPFQCPLAPSPTPPPHRNRWPEYARHDQETAPARYTTALRHRPGLTAHASSHSSVTLPSHQWLAIDDLSSHLRRFRAIKPIALIGPLPFKAYPLLSHLFSKLAGTLAQVDRYPFSHPGDHVESIRLPP